MRSLANDSNRPLHPLEKLLLRVASFWKNGGWSPIIWAWLLALVVVAIAHGVFQPIFSTVDDPLQSFIAKGDLAAAESDAHLLGVNYLLGSVLCALYGWLNFVPWYGLFMLAVQFVASAGVYYSVLAVARTRMQVILLIAVAVAVDINSMAYPQFTAIALYSGTAGFILWLVSVQAKRSPKWWEGVWSTSLFFLCFLMAKDAAIVIACVGLPIVAYGIVASVRGSNSQSRWSNAVAAAAPLVVALLLSAGAKVVHESTYENDRSWRGVQHAVELRSRALQTLQYTDSNQAAFEKVGWSRNDYETFMLGMAFDREVFSREDVSYLLSHTTHASNNAAAFVSNLFLDRRSSLLLFATICVFLFVPVNSRGMLAWVNLLGVLAVCACAAFNSQFMAPEFHQQIMLYLLLAALLAADEPFFVFTRVAAESGTRKKGDQGVIAFARAVLAAGCSRTLWQVILVGAFAMNAVERVSRSNGEQIYYRVVRDEWRESISKLNPQPDETYVAVHGAFPYDAIAPTDSLLEYHSLNVVALEWTQLTPIHNAQLQSLGISDLAEAMISNDRVFVFSNDEANAVMIRYFEEHSGKSVVAELKHEFQIGRQYAIFNRTYRVYQFREN